MGRSPETVTVATRFMSEDESVNEDTATMLPDKSDDDVDAETKYRTSPKFFSLNDTEKEEEETEITVVNVGAKGAGAKRVTVETTEENPETSPPCPWARSLKE